MRGASALAGLLRGRGMPAYVVWEPVLESDLGPPPPGVTDQFDRASAHLYWDGERRLSAVLRAAAREPRACLGDPEGDEPVWDVAFVHPAGGRFAGGAPPTSSYCDRPVVRVVAPLGAALDAAQGRPAGHGAGTRAE